jgi:hypothetical protein
MSQASQALVYAMLVENHYDHKEQRAGSRRSPRTPILRRFLA